MAADDELFVQIGGRDVGLQALLAKVDAEMQKDADSAARLGQAYGRLAVAQGQPKLASQVLAGTLQQAGGASERALIGIETQAARLASGGSSYFQQFGSAAASSLGGIVGPAALASAAIGGVIAIGKSFADAFTFKATLDADAASLKSALTGFRDVGATTAEATRFGREFYITQQETNSILTSSIDVLKQSTSSVSQLETALLRLNTRDVTKPISEAARAVRELQAGDVTSIRELFNVPAKDALKMKNEILGGADAIQVLTAWEDKAGVGMGALEQRTAGAAGKMHELALAQEDLTLAQAKFAQGPGLAIVGEEVRVVSGLTRVLSGDWQSMAASAHDAIASAGASMSQMIASGGALGAIYRLLTGEAQAAAGATVQHATATLRSADADDRNAASSAGLSSALDAELGKKLDGAIATAALAQRQAQLDSDSRLAAQGLLGAGDQAVILANKYNIAGNQAEYLIQQQQRLSNAAALAEQRAGERSPGTSGQAEAIDQENRRLQQLYRTLANPPKVARGGGGGGGVRLSDQTKLQNSLLASQESYQNKSEDASAQYATDVEKIYQDFYEKMRTANKDFNQEQLDSRAGFYDQLGSIESPKIAQAASAAYEAASIEAGKIAQEKGADVAEKYMQAQEQIISARAKRLADIEKAAKDKDKDKAEYLTGVDAEYKKAEDAKLARIKEGEGSLTTERDKQLSDSAAKADEAQGKIATAAERASERQITAADRAGKKIDENTLKAGKLADTYDRVAPTGEAKGQPTAAGSTTATTGAPSDDPIVSALNAAKDAIVAALGSVKNAADGTTSAVRATGGKFAS